jgi:ParB-like chromosome segregation protein Spo0J
MSKLYPCLGKLGDKLTEDEKEAIKLLWRNTPKRGKTAQQVKADQIQLVQTLIDETQQERNYVVDIISRDIKQKEEPVQEKPKEEKVEQKEQKVEKKEEPVQEKPKEEKVEQPKVKVSNEVETVKYPLADINLDTKRFQNRTKLNENIVQNIVDDYNEAEFDPVHIWIDPKDNKAYLLAGHHRYEAAKRLGLEKVKAEVRNDLTTEADAITFAKERSNANRTLESQVERANIYRQKRLEGMSKAQLEKEAAKNEGKGNGKRILMISMLNPDGNIIQTMIDMQNSASDDFKIIDRIANYVGELRYRNAELTDAHEEELYRWLFEDGAIKNYDNKLRFIDLIDKFITKESWNPEQPIGVRGNKVARSSETIEVDRKLQEARKERSQLEKDRKAFEDGKANLPFGLSAQEYLNEFTQKIANIDKEILKLTEERRKSVEADRLQDDLFSQILEESGNEEAAKDIIEKSDPEQLEKLAENLDETDKSKELLSQDEIEREIAKADRLLQKPKKVTAKSTSVRDNTQTVVIENDEITITNRSGRNVVKVTKFPLVEWEKLDKSFGNPAFNKKQFIEKLESVDMYEPERPEVDALKDRIIDSQISAINKAFEAYQNPNESYKDVTIVKEVENLYSGRTTLQQLLDQKRHLQLSLEDLERIKGLDIEARKNYPPKFQRDVDITGRAAEIRSEIKRINKAIERERQRNENERLSGQTDLFGEEFEGPDQQNLFEPNTPYESLPSTVQKVFDDQISFDFTENNSNVYTTEEKTPIRMRSELQFGTIRKLPKLSYRPLQEGEFSKIERKYRAFKVLNFFSRKEKVESPQDVAFIFNQLEGESIEHAFVLHIPENGSPIVQHISTGSFNASLVDPKSMIDAIDRFGTKELYFIHNHPSGNLESSAEDRLMLKRLRASMPSGVTLHNGIIIDTKQNKFGIFDTLANESVEKAVGKKRLKLKALSFSRQVYHDVDLSFKIKSPADIAKFLTESRFNTGAKYTLLTLNSANNIVGKFNLTQTELNQSLADEIAVLVVRSGGVNAVLSGNRVAIEEEGALRTVRDILKIKDITLLDYVAIHPSASNSVDAYHSAIENVILEPRAEYGTVETQRGFYSKVEQLIIEKAPGKNIKAKDLIKMLENNGAKKEELEWLDIEGYLEENPKATKEDLIQYVRDNNVQIQEVVLGELSQDEAKETREELKRLEEEFAEKAVNDETLKQLQWNRDKARAEVNNFDATDAKEQTKIALEASLVNKNVRRYIANWFLERYAYIGREFRSKSDANDEYAKQMDAIQKKLPAWIEDPIFTQLPDPNETMYDTWVMAYPLGYNNYLIDQETQQIRSVAQYRDDKYSDLIYEMSLLRKELERSPTKFENWTLPEGTNYQELLITKTVPKLSIQWERRTRKDELQETLGIENPREEVYYTAEFDGRTYEITQNEYGDWVGVGSGGHVYTNSSSSVARAMDLMNEYIIKYLATTTDQYFGGHFDQANILAHVRYKDRVIDGKKVLFVEEIQSDLHQQGKKLGYHKYWTRDLLHVYSTEDAQRIYGDNLADRFHYIQAKNEAGQEVQVYQIPKTTYLTEDMALQYVMNKKPRSGEVADAPYKKTWHEMAFKRILRKAVQGGYEGIAWTTGEQQAERYDLAKTIEGIAYSKTEEGLYDIYAYNQSNNTKIVKIAQSEAQLEELLSKDVAKRIIQDEGDPYNFEGLRNVDLMTSLRYDGKTLAQITNEPANVLRQENWVLIRAYLQDARGDKKQALERMQDRIEALSERESGQKANRDIITDLRIAMDILQALKITRVKEWSKVLKGQLLKIGGSGMKGFYDKMVPAFVNKYTKKWGGKVIEGDIGFTQQMELISAEAAREAWRSGKEVFATYGAQFAEDDKYMESILDINDYASGGYDFYIDDGSAIKSTIVHYLPFTDKMKGAVEQGQTLYDPQAEYVNPLNNPTNRKEMLNTVKDFDRLSNKDLGDIANIKLSEVESKLEEAGLLESAKILSAKAQMDYDSVARILLHKHIVGENLITEPEPAYGSGEKADKALEYYKKLKAELRPGSDIYPHWVKMMVEDYGFEVRRNIRDLWKETIDHHRSLPETPFRERFRPARVEEIQDELFDNEFAPLELDFETIMQKVQFRVQDKLNRSQQVVDLVREVRELSDGEDFRLQAELYIGRASDQIAKLKQKMMNNKDGFLKRLDDAGYTPDDFGEFIYAQHATERNDDIFRKNKKRNGSGIDPDEIARILAKYEGDQTIREFEKEFRETVINPSLDLQLKSGLITQERYDEYKEQYDYYVPLKGNEKKKIKYRLTGKGYSVTTTGLFSAEGRGSIPDNPFLQAIIDFENVIVRAEKNRVGQSLLKFIELHPDIVSKESGERLFTVKKQRIKQKYNKYGEPESVEKLIKVKDEDLVVWDKGKQKIVTIKDEALVKGLKNMGTERGYVFLDTINRYLRNVITTMNPEFMITNFQRDIQTALINVQAEGIEGITMNIIKDVPKAMNGIWKDERSKPGNEWTKWYEEFRSEGGQTGWLEYESLTQKTRSFEKAIKNYKQSGKIVTLSKDTIKLIEDMNLAVENGTRLAVYKNLREKGMSKQRAASVAKNVTVNFNKKGSWGSFINTLWLFSNAGIQGSARILKSLKHKKVQKTVAGVATLSFLLNMMNRAIDEEEYEKLNGWVKDNHWVIMMGNGKHVKLKVPYGFNVFSVAGNVVGDMFADVMKGDTSTRRVGQGIGRMFKGLVDGFSPFGGTESMMQFFAPTIADPFVQIAENKNFFAAPIMPEQPAYTPNVANNTLYFRSVTPHSLYAARYLNMLTGGEAKDPLTDSEQRDYDKLVEMQEKGEKLSPTQIEKYKRLHKKFTNVTSGWVDISPEVLDHLIDFGFGGTGRFVTNAFTTTWKVTNAEEVPLNRIPGVRQLIGEQNKYADRQLVYSMLDESARTEYTDKERKLFFDTLTGLQNQGLLDETQANRIKTTFKKAQGIKEKSGRQFIERNNQPRQFIERN